MEVLLEVDTYDRKLLADLMENPEVLKRGMKVRVQDVMDIILNSLYVWKGFGFESVETIFGRDNKKVKAISITCYCLRLPSRKNHEQIASVSKIKKIRLFAIFPFTSYPYVNLTWV